MDQLKSINISMTFWTMGTPDDPNTHILSYSDGSQSTTRDEVGSDDVNTKCNTESDKQ